MDSWPLNEKMDRISRIESDAVRISRWADQFVWLGRLARHAGQGQREIAIHDTRAETGTPRASRGCVPQALIFWVYCLAPEALLFRRMLMGLEAFWEWPCAQTHLKKALNRTRPVGEAYDKYQRDLWMPPVKHWLFVHCILYSKTFFLIKLLDVFRLLCYFKFMSYNTDTVYMHSNGYVWRRK